MYNEEIKNLLIKNFGEPKASLSIGVKSRNNNLRTYYYKMSNEKEINEFLFVVNNMTKESISKFKELINLYDIKERYISESCACYLENDSGWEIEFYGMKKIKYRRTIGNKIAAFIELDEKPLAVLKEDDILLYGLFGRPNYVSEMAHRQESEGMSYWINKYMYLNESFRSFIVDFLYLIGNENNIYKDISRTIKKTYCFLPEINYLRLMLCKKPSEIFDALNIDYKKFNINPNRMDINAFYIISQVLPYIHKLDYRILLSIKFEMITRLIDAGILFNGMSKKESIATFISNFYIYKEYLKELDPAKHKKYIVGIPFSAEAKRILSFAKDYAISCIELNEPIRLIYNEEQLIKKHDKIAVALRHKEYTEEKDLPLIAVPSKFDALENKIQNNYPNMFKRICSTKELYDEGEYQHNCVFSRKQMLRNDLASIYHWNYQNKDFTIQFSIDLNGRYKVDEIKARFNEPCGKDDRKDIDKIIDDINKKVA